MSKENTPNREMHPVPCKLTYGKTTKSGNVLPTTEAVTMELDWEALEFVFCDEKNFEVLRVSVDNVEILEMTASGLFSPKTELLAVTEVDSEGSILVFDAKEISKKDRDTVVAMVEAFTSELYFRRGKIWERDEAAYEAYCAESEE